MYSDASEQFKKGVKDRVIISTARLTFKDFFPDDLEQPDLVLNNSNISDNGVKISDYCYNNGQLVGTAMTKEAEIELKNTENYDLADKTFDLEIGIKISEDNSEVLPSEYRRVKYIESTGTQYINTGYLTESKFKLKIKFSPQNITTRQGMGVNGSTPNWFSVEQSGLFSFNNTRVCNLTIGKVYDLEYYFQEQSPRANINVKDQNGTILGQLTNVQRGASELPICLWRINTDTSGRGIMKIYSCQIYNSSNTLVRDFIPCYRISDDEIGMYDIINGVFYSNEGTGTFEKGTDLPDFPYEYVPYGEYTVTKYEDLKSNKKYKIVAYDNMDKLNVEFKNNTAFVFNPTSKAEYTLKDFYTDFMASYGIEVEQQTLPNENFVVTEMPNFEGYTARSILMRIAEIFGSFAKINRENKCQMYLKTDTDIQIELSTMNSKLEIDKQYGPVNVVSIGMSNVEGENVTKIDAESIAEYGETTIKIDDNPFLYTEDKRESVINDLYDRLHNFTYIPVKFNLKALMYTDCGDAIQVRNMENTDWISTMILNQNINVPRTRQSVIETKALTNTDRTNKYISKSKQEKTRTELMVDKQNQLIQSLVAITTSLDENTSILSAEMQNKLEELGQALTDYQATVSTQFSQTNTSFEMQFNQLIESIAAAESGDNERFAEINKYIRFVDGNIILGRSDNALTLTIQNDRISYQQNGSEVAYFSNNKLYVKTLEVLESLRLGNFAFTPRSNGSLTFGKVV